MSSKHKSIKFNLISQGQNLLSKNPGDLAFTVTQGSQLVEVDGREFVGMSTIGTLAKIDRSLDSQVGAESFVAAAVHNDYMFLFGADRTTPFHACVYRNYRNGAFSKIKDFGAGADEAGPFWSFKGVLSCFYDDGAFKRAYSSDEGSNWTVGASPFSAYPTKHWVLDNILYVDVSGKIFSSVDGISFSEWWNYSSIIPSDLVFWMGFYYVVGVRSADNTVSFGRLENGAYNEIRRFSRSHVFGIPALSLIQIGVVIVFTYRGSLQFWLYDLDNLIQLGNASDIVYSDSVLSVGRDNKGGAHFSVASVATSDFQHHWYVDHLGRIFKHRVWPAHYDLLHYIEHYNTFAFIIWDSTAELVRVCLDDSNYTNSLVSTIKLSTNYAHLEPHIPVAVRVFHDYGLNGSAWDGPDITVDVILDGFFSPTAYSFVCSQLLHARGDKEATNDWYSSDVASNATFTVFTFPPKRSSASSTVAFDIHLLSDTSADACHSPYIHAIEYIYLPLEI